MKPKQSICADKQTYYNLQWRMDKLIFGEATNYMSKDLNELQKPLIGICL